MHDLAERLLKRTRKSFFRKRPLFEPNVAVDQTELDRIEHKLGSRIPQDLREWLLVMGYGNVDDVLSIQADWLHPVERGHLKGAAIFGQDDLGNFYAYLPSDGRIVYFSRSSHEYAVLAPNFLSFMEELERRDFKLGEWVDHVAALPYGWDA